ncbi:hypothetical protein CG399_00690, partial [Bifidobacteriaceae bacterium NR015]
RKEELLISLPERCATLDYKQVKIIEEVCVKLGNLTGNQLSERTHKEDPWIRARIGVPEDKGSEEIISKQSIHDYYVNHPIV